MGQFQAQDYAKLLPIVGAGAALVYYIVKNVRAVPGSPRAGQVNPDIQKNEAKVVHMVDIEDIGEKAAFCRCWRSKKFPYCDGSHGKHNEETGDNVGPVVVKHKS